MDIATDTMALLANILLARSVEGRLRALHVAQSNTLRREPIGAPGGRRVAESATARPRRVLHAEVRDHVVLVHAVAGDADRPHERFAAIDGHAAREDLCAIAQLANARFARERRVAGQPPG